MSVLNLVMDKISKLDEEFNPTFYYDNETFIEKLLKIGKQLQKKPSIHQKKQQNLRNCKGVDLFF